MVPSSRHDHIEPDVAADVISEVARVATESAGDPGDEEREIHRVEDLYDANGLPR